MHTVYAITLGINRKSEWQKLSISLTLFAARARTIDRRFKRSGEWPIFLYSLNHSKPIEIFFLHLLRNSFYQTTVSGDYSTIDYAIIYLSRDFLLVFVSLLDIALNLQLWTFIDCNKSSKCDKPKDILMFSGFSTKVRKQFLQLSCESMWGSGSLMP